MYDCDVSPDIDECSSAEGHMCDSNADCTNTLGSYDCVCDAGFSGDGYSCQGMALPWD